MWIIHDGAANTILQLAYTIKNMYEISLAYKTLSGLKIKVEQKEKIQAEIIR